MDISYFDQTCQVLLNCENGKMQNKYPPAFIKSNTFVKINTREMSTIQQIGMRENSFFNPTGVL